jgi:tripartite-type tricarboxylate transporter receptor subunit TctC
MAPVGTPKAVVDQLNGAISRIVGSADVREAWQKQGAQPMVMTPVDFGKFLEGDIEKWARIVAISGAKPE